jgi:hypothetical protein
MKRSRNDSEGWRKGALGKYIEPSGVRPGSGFNYGGAGTNPKGCGKYTTDDSGLTNKLPDDGTAPASKDIYSDVCRNSLDDDAGGSRPGPIGVD